MDTSLNKYEIDCPHCSKEISFRTYEVDELASDIDEEVERARFSTRQEVESEFDGMVDPGDIPVQPQTIKELSAAIRTGDKFTAELLLDRIADDLGGEHINAVQIGRFTPAVALGGAS